MREDLEADMSEEFVKRELGKWNQGTLPTLQTFKSISPQAGV